MADTKDLKSFDESHLGSNPSAPTKMIEIRACTHCYDVEDGYPCCICDSEGWTDNPDYWERY